MVDVQEQFISFMEVLEQRCQEVGIDFAMLCIDHICRRVTTQQEYRRDKKYFSHRSVAYAEGPFHNRMFCLFLLQKPLVYKDHEIYYVELPEPGGSGVYELWFQHIEVITKELFAHVHFGQHEAYHASVSYEGKICVQRPDHMAIKVTEKNVFAKALTEDGAKLIVCITPPAPLK